MVRVFKIIHKSLDLQRDRYVIHQHVKYSRSEQTCEEILNRDIICTKYTDFRIKTLDSR